MKEHINSRFPCRPGMSATYSPIVIVGVCLFIVAGSAVAGSYGRWRGDDGTGAAADTGDAMVESWDDARLLWVSEEPTAISSKHFGGLGWPGGALGGNGGYANPVYKDGRIYMLFFKPSGQRARFNYRGTKIAKGDTSERYYKNADDIIICVDAHTGKTLWRTVMKGRGFNHHGCSKNYGGHYTPCVKDGYVYAPGSMGMAYCVDAKTGKLKWETGLGAMHDAWAYHKAVQLQHDRQLMAINLRACMGKKAKDADTLGILDSKLDKGKVRGVDSNLINEEMDPELDFDGSLDPSMFNGAAIVAEGVACFYAGALVAVDCETGKIRWTKPGAYPNTSSAAIWKHKGREYIVTTGGGVSVFDPKNGKRILNYKDAGGRRGPAVFGDYCFVQAKPTQEQRYSDACDEEAIGEVCLKLSLDGIERLWELHRGAGSGYSFPVVNHGILWHYCRGYPGFADGTRPGTKIVPGYKDDLESQFNIILGTEVATGKIVGHIENAPLKNIGSLNANNNRMVCHSAQAQRCPSPPRGLYLYDLDPGNPRYLGNIRANYALCTSPIIVDGKLIYRTPNYLLACYDLRADPKQFEQESTPAGCEDDYARYVIELNDFTCTGKSIRLHIGYHNGQFRQVWTTVPPHFNVALPTFPAGLTLKKGRLVGQVRTYIESLPHLITLDCKVAEGKVTGTYECEGEVKKANAKILTHQNVHSVPNKPTALADKDNCTIRMDMHRFWLMAGYVRYAGSYDGGGIWIRVKNGKIVEVSARSDTDRWTAQTVGHDLKYDGKTLTGTASFKTVSNLKDEPPVSDEVTVVKFNARQELNLLLGRVKVVDGFMPGREYTTMGTAYAAEGKQFSAENGIIDILMGRGIPAPQQDNLMRLCLQMRDGKVVAATACGVFYGQDVRDNGDACDSIFTVTNFENVEFKDNRLSGSVDVIIPTDRIGIPVLDVKVRETFRGVTLKDGVFVGPFLPEYNIREKAAKPLSGNIVRM